MNQNKVIIFCRRHWIGVWILISVLYALIIQFLFSFTTDNNFLTAHWGAGDILTYASTVSLGLLALWQNKKIQEENDTAQEKLENIIERTNELNIISKIIEHEEHRFYELQLSMNDFLQNCDPQALALALKPNDKIEYLANITELERNIDKGFFEISRLLMEDKVVKQDDKHPLKIAYAKIYAVAKQTINGIQIGTINILDEKIMSSVADNMADTRNIFMSEKEKYLSTQQERLSKLLFENLSLNEVRELYSENILSE